MHTRVRLRAWRRPFTTLSAALCGSIFGFTSGDSCNDVNSVWCQDPQYASGWDYLDTWVQWANTHGGYIIIDMHTPPGGLQLSPEGATLWTNSQNADCLKRLWRAIAKRYANEPRIAAYDILNEPAAINGGPVADPGGGDRLRLRFARGSVAR